MGIRKIIHSVDKVRQHTDNKYYFVQREIKEFIDIGDNFKIIYAESIFDKFQNSEGKVCQETIREFSEKSIELNPIHLNYFFKKLQTPIQPSDNFTEKFNILQTQALLVDTISQNNGKGRYGTIKWIIPTESDIILDK